MHLDRTARRILGSLLEKRFSTPEQYPLTLNSLVLACNQRSNRDPFTDLEPFLVEGCLTQLRIAGFITIVERDTGRAVRYKERLADSLGLTEKEAAVLAELLLRGPQTEQELARRTERMRKLASPEEALQILEGLASRKIVEHMPRASGERIARWRHLLTPANETDGEPPRAAAAAAATPASEKTTALMPDLLRNLASSPAGDVSDAAHSGTFDATTRALPSERTTAIAPNLLRNLALDAAGDASDAERAGAFDATTRAMPTVSHADEIAALHARIADMARTIDDLKSEVRGLRAAWDEFRNSR